MVMQFKDLATMQNYHNAVEQHLDWPFCLAAMRSGQQARVLEALPGQGYRVLVCEQERWTEWTPQQQSHVSKAPTKPNHRSTTYSSV